MIVFYESIVIVALSPSSTTKPQWLTITESYYIYHKKQPWCISFSAACVGKKQLGTWYHSLQLEHSIMSPTSGILQLQYIKTGSPSVTLTLRFFFTTGNIFSILSFKIMKRCLLISESTKFIQHLDHDQERGLLQMQLHTHHSHCFHVVYAHQQLLMKSEARGDSL